MFLNDRISLSFILNHLFIKDGNVEAACGMAKRKIQASVCDANVKNEMAIAILNSDIGFHKYASSSESDEHHHSRLYVY